MKQNTGKEVRRGPRTVCGGPAGRSDLESDLFPMCQEQSHVVLHAGDQSHGLR
jgi:hypothetical protein